SSTRWPTSSTAWPGASRPSRRSATPTGRSWCSTRCWSRRRAAAGRKWRRRDDPARKPPTPEADPPMTHEFSRRDFLKLGGGGRPAAAWGGAGVAEPAKKRTLKKAIMYATIGFPGSVMEKFKAVKEAGFDGVEPMSHMKQDEVLKALEENGL